VWRIDNSFYYTLSLRSYHFDLIKNSAYRNLRESLRLALLILMEVIRKSLPNFVFSVSNFMEWGKVDIGRCSFVEKCDSGLGLLCPVICSSSVSISFLLSYFYICEVPRSTE